MQWQLRSSDHHIVDLKVPFGGFFSFSCNPLKVLDQFLCIDNVYWCFAGISTTLEIHMLKISCKLQRIPALQSWISEIYPTMKNVFAKIRTRSLPLVFQKGWNMLQPLKASMCLFPLLSCDVFPILFLTDPHCVSG